MTRIYFYVAIAAVLAFLCVAVIVLLKIIGMKNVEIKALSESLTHRYGSRWATRRKTNSDRNTSWKMTG